MTIVLECESDFNPDGVTLVDFYYGGATHRKYLCRFMQWVSGKWYLMDFVVDTYALAQVIFGDEG